MATAAAAVTLGISVELVATAISALGIGIVGAVLTGKAIEQIKEWIKTRPISTEIKANAKTKKHDFNDKCGNECILSVARNLKIYSSWFADKGIPYIRGTGNCKHGCELEVRMSIPPFQQEWKIQTAFHKGICNAV